MVGTDLNLTLPDNGESMATNIQRIAVALAAIEDSLADLVTQAGIDINGTFELNGNMLSEVSSVQFASGNVNNIAGSIYYYNGEFYLVDTTGTIQLTNNGQINVAGVGGIVGDYGGTNPAAVTFVDSSGQYVFTEDTGVYADLVADDVQLKGSAGTLVLSASSDITGTRSFNFGALPTSGVAGLVYDSADSTLKQASVVRETTTHQFTNIDLTGDIKRTDMTMAVPLAAALPMTMNYVDNGDSVNRLLSGTATCLFPIDLKPGDRLKTIFINAVSSNEPTISVYKQNEVSAVLAHTSSHLIINDNCRLITLNTPYTVSVDPHPTGFGDVADTLWLKMTAGSADLLIGSITVVYDHP